MGENKSKKKRGGQRVGAGAPALPKGEKKKPVVIFVKEKHMDAMGGKSAVKTTAEESVVRAANKKSRKFPLFGI